VQDAAKDASAMVKHIQLEHFYIEPPIWAEEQPLT